MSFRFDFQAWPVIDPCPRDFSRAGRSCLEFCFCGIYEPMTSNAPVNGSAPCKSFRTVREEMIRHGVVLSRFEPLDEAQSSALTLQRFAFGARC